MGHVNARQEFLRRVSEAVQAGNFMTDQARAPIRGTTGYQGAGVDPIEHLRKELLSTGCVPYLVPDQKAVADCVVEIVRNHGAARVLLQRDPVVDALDIAGPLRALGAQVTVIPVDATAFSREELFNADLSVTSVDALVAETGSLVVAARADHPRSLSLLPPIHVVVAHTSQMLPDLFDFFASLGNPSVPASAPQRLPSCLTLITGPSKTGDIELKLVTGVHGPREVHVILIAS